jgi:hypothetical protein
MSNSNRRCVLAPTPKKQQRQTPTWLDEAVYEPKRQHTFDVVKQAIDLLVEQRKLDGSTRISLSTITATTRQLDPAGKGVAHTTILEHEEAYAYYKHYRTAATPKKRQEAASNVSGRPVIKADRDQASARQRYRRLSREELVDQLLSVEQRYAELHERYLATNDLLLQWQLRAEAAEAQLHTRDGQRGTEETGTVMPARYKRRQRKRTERTTGPLSKYLVSLNTFANRHNVPEQKVLTHVTMDIPLLKAVHGEWTDTEGTVITLALDSAGRAAFYQLYHDMPSFVECDQCPHQER